MRSDRFGSRFALLILAFPQREPLDLAPLARLVSARTRETDDAGLLGPSQLGLLLPETPAAGAWKLGDDLCALLTAHMPQPSCDVYIYPGEPADDEFATSERRTNGKASNRHAVNGRAGRTERRGARPMHTFFVRPLPLWKRAIDVVGASVALLLAAPLMLAAAAAIKLTSRGPIIFKQARDTIGGRRFTIYKFRTMTADAESKKAALLRFSEQDGPAFKIAKDPRITWLGRFLRQTSIDELPQLFNVIKGDMTLVGPRAMDSNESRNCERWQRRRLDVTAGLTCIWQVRGRSAVAFVEWMRMDLCYIRNRSLLYDLKLMAQTVPAVLLRRGAH
jgi:lipopolysaccharide/colanic/teichoic acid biosynthesis glycosyltransferase